jgi:hypothetical protein
MIFCAPKTCPATVTLDEHVAVRPIASAALQFTGVDPIGNAEPDAGVQMTLTGGVPPLTVAVNVTACAADPIGATADVAAGHVSDRPVTTVGGGVTVVGLEHPANAATIIATVKARRGDQDMRN